MRKSNFALRLQPSLLEEAHRLAESEGVAPNQHINVAVAEKLLALRIEELFQRASSPCECLEGAKNSRACRRRRPVDKGRRITSQEEEAIERRHRVHRRKRRGPRVRLRSHPQRRKEKISPPTVKPSDNPPRAGPPSSCYFLFSCIYLRVNLSCIPLWRNWILPSKRTSSPERGCTASLD